MRQGIADIHRRAHVSQAANNRYIEALATVEQDTAVGELLSKIARPAALDGRRVRAINPAAADDLALLTAVNRGEFVVRGFRNREIRVALYGADSDDPREVRRRAARVTRLIRIPRGYGLVSKVQHTQRYLVTVVGRRTITAALAVQAASVAALVDKAA